MNNQDGSNLVVKIVALWAMIGVTSWSEAASLAAFLLTMYLLCRHVWRDLARPFLESRSLIKRRIHRSPNDDDMEGV